MRKLIPVLLAALVFFAGCHKQDSYTYSGIEAGTLSAGIFTSDNGTQMAIVGNEGKYDVSSTRRVLISYETEPVTDPSRISINLLGLLDAGILSKCRYGVKILGGGELQKKLTVSANAFSQSAKEKIEAAGGKAEVL